MENKEHPILSKYMLKKLSKKYYIYNTQPAIKKLV